MATEDVALILQETEAALLMSEAALSLKTTSVPMLTLMGSWPLNEQIKCLLGS